MSADLTFPHPHDLEAARIPARLDAAELRDLSRIEPWRAIRAIAAEWIGIAAAIAAASWAAHPLVTLLAVLFIGARQHALLVIAHDAAHFRLLPDRAWNDRVGNLFLSWPMFVSVQGFRHFHSAHHRFLNAEGDGNRLLWHTHDAAGGLAPEWRYPKTAAGLIGTILWRGAIWTGVWWMIRGIIGGFSYGMTAMERAARLVAMLIAVAALTGAGAWEGFLVFWVLPYCTWQVAIQYTRLICEHSNVQAAGLWADTRTTIPTPLEAWFVLPRGIGYHIEHHWYPSVPFYRLPDLHARLMRDPEFAANANVSGSVQRSLAQVIRRP